MPRPGLQRKRAMTALSQAELGPISQYMSSSRPADRMYATDVRETDVRQYLRLMPPGRGHNNQITTHILTLHYGFRFLVVVHENRRLSLGQYVSSLLLKVLVSLAVTTQLGKLFHMSTTLLEK